MKPDQLHIRFAEAGDAAALAALGAQTFRDTFGGANTAGDMQAYLQTAFSVDAIRRELEDVTNTFLLAFADDEPGPVGYAKLRAGPPDDHVRGLAPIELQRLYAARTHIGHGIGGALLQAALDVAHGKDYLTLWLGVWEHNPRAIAFYRRWGFTTAGDHVFRLGSDDQRDLIMERPIAPAA